MRHLTFDQAKAAIERGRQIDQLLGRHHLRDEKVVLRWLSVSPTGQRYVVTLHEVFESGLDGSSGPVPVDSEEPVNEGRHIETFDDARRALESLEYLGARTDKWVNPDVLQDEINDAKAIEPDGHPDLSDGVLDLLLSISGRADQPPWQSWVEGRDHTAGSSFIMVGKGDDRKDDLYIQRDTTTRANAELDDIAYARNYLPLLIAEIRDLRTGGGRCAKP